MGLLCLTVIIYFLMGNFITHGVGNESPVIDELRSSIVINQLALLEMTSAMKQQTEALKAITEVLEEHKTILKGICHNGTSQSSNAGGIPPPPQPNPWFRPDNGSPDSSQTCHTAGSYVLVPGPLGCPPPYELVLGECFFVNELKLTWSSARQHCRGMGGDLAVPERLYALKFYLRQRGIQSDVFLGGSDSEAEGDWRWVNGASVNSADWQAKQPNDYDGQQNCLAMYTETHPVLNDVNCEDALKSVCQFK